MSIHAVDDRTRVATRRPSASREHLSWLAAGLAVAFLVPYVLADVLEMPRDAYYGVYSAAAFGLFVGWARSTHQSLVAMVRRRWRLALGLGVAFAAVMAAVVLAAEDSSARPGGAELVGAVIWRGVVYGLADGLLLSAFPILVVFAALDRLRRDHGRRGTLAVGAAALAASLLMAAVYHAGYSDFRSEKLGNPVAGDVVWSVPTLVTLNPIGAPIAHAGLHVTAVLHSYETDLFLPPHR